MSSPELRPLPATPFSCDMPDGLMYEFLLRIPAKELCRRRDVCNAWRDLTYDPHFIAAHMSRHPTAAPLLATAYRDDGEVNGVTISDLSGNVVKRIPVPGYDIGLTNESGDVVQRISNESEHDSICVVRNRLDLVCIRWNVYSGAFWVLDPLTGAIIFLPADPSEEFKHESREIKWRAFGKVSSTGEYKALRVSIIHDRQVCEVITLEFDGTNHGSWRRKSDPPSRIWSGRKMRCVVVDGVVYFLIKTGFNTTEPVSIASFNLDTEEWMGVLHGPEELQRFVQEEDNYTGTKLQLSLAELNGCLVMVHNNYYRSMDLWFLTDCLHMLLGFVGILFSC